MGMVRNGHSLRRVDNGTTFLLICKCTWTTQGLIGAPDGAEQLGFEHLTGETSDDSNQARVKAAGLFYPSPIELANVPRSIVVP